MEIMRKRIRIAWTLTAAMIFNLVLSLYIYIQENVSSLSNDVCFAGGINVGSCAQVKSSVYGSFFGIPVSVFGMIAFLFMAIAMGSFAISLKHGKPIPHIEHDSYLDLLHIAFVLGAFFALAFILLQITVIGAICRYCMFTDFIMIVSTILFIVSFKR